MTSKERIVTEHVLLYCGNSDQIERLGALVESLPDLPDAAVTEMSPRLLRDALFKRYSIWITIIML